MAGPTGPLLSDSKRPDDDRVVAQHCENDDNENKIDPSITVVNVKQEQLRRAICQPHIWVFRWELLMLVTSLLVALGGFLVFGALYLVLDNDRRYDVQWGRRHYKISGVCVPVGIVALFFLVLGLHVLRRIFLFLFDHGTIKRRKVAMLNGTVNAKKNDYLVVLCDVWSMALLKATQT